jgi:hypothetical protein
MARYTETLRDQNLRAIPGALVSVTAMDGTTAVLTDDSAQHLDNPFLTDAYGNYTFNTSAGIYTISFTYGGRTILKEVVTAGTLIANLAPDPANAGKFIALDADGVPTYSSGTGADAGLRTDLAQSGGSSLVTFAPDAANTYSTSLSERLNQNRSILDFIPKELHATILAGGNAGDVTAYIQTAFDNSVGLWCPQRARFYVTHVTISGLGRFHDLSNCTFVGMASTPTNAVIELKCGRSEIRGLRVSAAGNSNYQAAIHYYTNNVLTYPVGYNRFVGGQVDGARIGLVIGGLPGQTTFESVYTQPGGAANGIAHDAPVSETTFFQWQATSCARGVFMNQPNGKLQFLGCHIASESIDYWTGYGAKSEFIAVHVVNQGSELSMSCGSCEHVQSASDGALIRVDAGVVNMHNVTTETTVPSYIAGQGALIVDSPIVSGINSAAGRPYLEVGPGASTTTISNGAIRHSVSTTSTEATTTAVNAIGGSRTPNLSAIERYHNTEISNSLWAVGGAVYKPIVRGVHASFHRCLLTVLDGAGARVSRADLDDGDNQLATIADTGAGSLPVYPVASNVTFGGWAYAVTGTGAYGREDSGLPTVEGRALLNLHRLVGGATGTVTMGPAQLVLGKKDSLNIIRAFIKTGTTSNHIKFEISRRTFDGSTIDSLVLFDGPESEFGSTWQPLMLAFQLLDSTPKYAIIVTVSAGADMRWTDITVR